MTEEKTKLTREEFRAICSPNEKPIDSVILRNDIRRNHVVVGADKLIDITEPKNIIYVEQKKRFEEDKLLGKRSDVEARKREVDLEKAREDLLIKQLTRLKLEGKMIDRELVGVIFKVHMKEAYQQIYFACEQIVVNVGHKLSATPEDLAELKGDLVTVLNLHMEKAREGSKKQLENIEKEHKENNNEKG